MDTKFHKQDGKFIVENKQDVEPFIRQAAVDRETLGEVPGLGYKIGTIPAVVIQDYLNTVGITFEEFMKDDTHIYRIMSDPDYKKFRVWEGKLGRAK